MNVFKKIREAKRKAMGYVDKKQQERADSVASDLVELRKKRAVLEARERVHRKADRERELFKKAEQNLRKRTPLYRVADAIKKNLKENKSNKGNISGISNTGPSPLQQSLGFSFGGKKEVKSKKRKGKTITITLK